MAVQNRLNNSTVPFIRSGESFVRENETIAQDAGRTVVLAFGTVMAKIAASQKWVPLTDIDATNGSAIAQGIYVGDDIAAADLVAGDVVGAPILVGGACTVDEGQIVLENSLTLNTVFTGASLAFDAGTGDSTATLTNSYVVTVRDLLEQRGIFIEETVDIDEFET